MSECDTFRADGPAPPPHDVEHPRAAVPRGAVKGGGVPPALDVRGSLGALRPPIPLPLPRSAGQRDAGLRTPKNDGLNNN